MIDTTVPLVANASQRTHGELGNDGDRNILDSVEYILSHIWADEAGRNRIGGVVIQDEQVFTARDVQKADARPGGYTTTGGHGGIVGSIGDPGPPVLTFVPVRRHTHTSEVNLSRLPATVLGVRRARGRIEPIPVAVKDERGALLATAIPKVGIVKDGAFIADSPAHGSDPEIDILGRLDAYLRDAPLAGFVSEGLAPFGTPLARARQAALVRAAYSGTPVVIVGRGNAEGFTPPQEPFIGGSNLTATKARLLLMACLLRFGSLPAATDPRNPTQDERYALRAQLAEYQNMFNTH